MLGELLSSQEEQLDTAPELCVSLVLTTAVSEQVGELSML